MGGKRRNVKPSSSPTGELTKADLEKLTDTGHMDCLSIFDFLLPLHLNLESVKDFLAAGIGQREDDTFRAGLVGGGDYPC